MSFYLVDPMRRKLAGFRERGGYRTRTVMNLMSKSTMGHLSAIASLGRIPIANVRDGFQSTDQIPVRRRREGAVRCNRL